MYFFSYKKKDESYDCITPNIENNVEKIQTTSPYKADILSTNPKNSSMTIEKMLTQTGKKPFDNHCAMSGDQSEMKLVEKKGDLFSSCSNVNNKTLEMTQLLNNNLGKRISDGSVNIKKRNSSVLKKKDSMILKQMEDIIELVEDQDEIERNEELTPIKMNRTKYSSSTNRLTNDFSKADFDHNESKYNTWFNMQQHMGNNEDYNVKDENIRGYSTNKEKSVMAPKSDNNINNRSSLRSYDKVSGKLGKTHRPERESGFKNQRMLPNLNNMFDSSKENLDEKHKSMNTLNYPLNDKTLENAAALRGMVNKNNAFTSRTVYITNKGNSERKNHINTVNIDAECSQQETEIYRLNSIRFMDFSVDQSLMKILDQSENSKEFLNEMKVEGLQELIIKAKEEKDKWTVILYKMDNFLNKARLIHRKKQNLMQKAQFSTHTNEFANNKEMPHRKLYSKILEASPFSNGFNSSRTNYPNKRNSQQKKQESRIDTNLPESGCYKGIPVHIDKYSKISSTSANNFNIDFPSNNELKLSDNTTTPGIHKSMMNLAGNSQPKADEFSARQTYVYCDNCQNKLFLAESEKNNRANQSLSILKKGKSQVIPDPNQNFGGLKGTNQDLSAYSNFYAPTKDTLGGIGQADGNYDEEEFLQKKGSNSDLKVVTKNLDLGESYYKGYISGTYHEGETNPLGDNNKMSRSTNFGFIRKRENLGDKYGSSKLIGSKGSLSQRKIQVIVNGDNRIDKDSNNKMRGIFENLATKSSNALGNKARTKDFYYYTNSIQSNGNDKNLMVSKQ